MEFTITELEIIECLGKGMIRPKEIAKAISKSQQQTSLSLQNLEKKNIVTRSKNLVNLEPHTHVAFLIKTLMSHPNLKKLLSDSGIKILTATLKPISVKDLIKETDLKKSIIYRKIRKAFDTSILREDNKKYSFNTKIWFDLHELLLEMKSYEMAIDLRIPKDGIIYFKNDSEIVFSTTKELDASLTAFSEYKDYGINLFSSLNYYYLPKKKLSLKDVFTHSLFVAQKDNEYRQLLYITLFYLKNRNALKRIKNPLLEQLKKVLSGEKIIGYPDISDIKEKAKQYNIKISR